ncbi:MAG: DUF6308 family protein [Acidimicrobiales bacterium]
MDYEFDEAQRVLAGYAFGPSDSDRHWKNRESFSVGAEPSAREPLRYAYQSYDCVPASKGPLDMADIVVSTGLNSRISARTMLAIYALAPDISAELALLPPPSTFWELDEPELCTAPDPPRQVRHMWRAWWLLMGIPGVGVAVTHKTLHHKRPRLCPLLDGKTVPYYRDGHPWAGIHRELTAHEAEFRDLEAWFAERADARGGVGLSRLRLHDILLWCHATKNRTPCDALGRELV